jgi:hypothetical protein
MPRSCHTQSGSRADTGPVSRTSLALVLIVAGLGVASWKSMIVVPALERARAGNGANAIAEASAFRQAAGELTTYQRIAGSYAGAALSTLLPVTLVWATDRAYCIQGASLHQLGPFGVPQPGPCPAG